MVQRKVANKTGIKPHLHILDTQLVNLKPSSSSSSSSQGNEKLKKIMKKSRSIKRPDESRSVPPFRNKKTPPTTPQKQSPNYMKSTSSFEARKEQSASPKIPTPNGSKTPKTNGSITTSLKVRTLRKTPSFKPFRSSKKVILCEEDVDSQRPTCSSTLKDSNFPDYLQLNELDGTSAMKVCPYSYCSLNGHHHAPVPPLKCFLSARRRALKTQKGFKLGCLSPRSAKKSAVKEPVIVTPEEVNIEDKEFFDDICSDDKEQSFAEIQGEDIVYIRPMLVGLHACEGLVHRVYSDDMENKGGQSLECPDIEWEEGYRSDSDQMEKKNVGKLYDEHEELYDEESVSSGAWSEEDGDSASDGSCEQMKINEDYMNNVAFEVSSSLTASESDINDKIDDPIEDQNMNYQEPTTVHDAAENTKDEADKNRTTIIYNIIQFNISLFINGEKTEHSVQVPATFVAADKMETGEAMEEQGMSNEHDEAGEVNQIAADEELLFDVQDIASTEQFNAIEKQDDPEQECNEYEAAITSDEITSETEINTNFSDKKSASVNELPDNCINLRDLTSGKKPGEEIGDDSREFNPRGPNFLPETPDPDAETVDLRHQTIDERKNAEEFMVDFALQQAVTTLAPARKRKVALLVEAFEKVMPDPVPVRGPVRIPGYEPHNRHTSKAFTNSRLMQACS